MVAAFHDGDSAIGRDRRTGFGMVLNTMSSVGGLRGWQWLFLLEAMPSLLAGLTTLFFLQDRPAKAKWLEAETKNASSASALKRMNRKKRRRAAHISHIRDAFRSPKIWILCFVYFGFVMGNYGHQLLASPDPERHI